jgi:hypothetical protein
VAAGDFNGDGKPDLAVANGGAFKGKSAAAAGPATINATTATLATARTRPRRTRSVTWLTMRHR